MKKIITFIVLLYLSSFSLQAEVLDSSVNTSTYTSIDQKDCVTLDSDNMGSLQECESFTSIGVKVIEGDIRQSIILTRNQQEYDLDFFTTVSPAFSSLGLKAEWRHELGKPTNLKGMIVRLEVSDDPENLDKTSSYLVVSKITRHEICVIAKVAPQINQNIMAREILDINLAMPCLKSY
ncbi:MAG: Unknown protein [uncultured Sulfurovum sp.]|uniref:Uncharacterized protein n=1 Tax=uncultured Sulfurovum sp. TaxID=269237 RepID=A0A6S6T2A4_9BACT|nr:MAG: Unknown protein [uncultured Sulfurovum sp.]